MERTLIAPGVHLSCDPAEKFNRCRISIHFAFPAQRATATAHALLPLVLERGYADCPDMTLLTKKLAKLYGADLTVDARPMGCNHNLCVSVTGIKDRFALEGEPLTREYASIALGAAFHPAFVGGVFDPQAVEIEKQMLKKALEDELNDKRIYCLRQANREFFGDSPAAVRQEGYLEEVDGLTPEQLTAAYREMLRTASIELIVLGYYCSASFQSFTGSMAVNSGVEHADAARAEQAILKELADLCDGPITDEELEDCRRGLLSGMNGVEDSLGGMETWYYIEVLRAGANSAAPIQTPAQARAALQAVTKEDVRSILRQLTLSVSYLLTKEGPTHA